MKKNSDLKHFKVKVLVNGKTSEHKIRKNPFMIGRGEDNHIVIESTEISRKHLTVQYKDSALFVEDNNSTNGTYFDGQVIPSQAMTEAKENSFIKLGYAEEIFIVIECITKSSSIDIKQPKNALEDTQEFENKNSKKDVAREPDGFSHLIGSLGKESLKSLKHYVKNSEDEIAEARKKAKLIITQAQEEAQAEKSKIVTATNKHLQEAKEQAQKLVEQSENHAEELVAEAKMQAQSIKEEQLKEINQSRDRLEEDVSHLQAKKEILSTDISKNEVLIKKLKNEKNTLAEDTEELHLDINEIENNIDTLKVKFEKEKRSIENELQKRQAKVDDIQKDYEDKILAIDNAESRVHKLKTEERNISQQIVESEKNLKKTKNEVEKNKKNAEREEKRIDELYARHESLEKSFTATSQMKKQEIEDLKDEITQTKEKIKVLYTQAESDIEKRHLEAEAEISKIQETVKWDANEAAQQITDAADQELINAKATCDKIKAKAEDDKQSIIDQAENIKTKAKQTLELAEKEKAEIIDLAEQESGKLISEASNYVFEQKIECDREVEDRREALEKELVNSKKAIDSDVTAYRLKKMKLIEKNIENKTQEENERLLAEKRILVKELQSLLITKFKKYLTEPNNQENISTIEFEIDKVTERVLLNVNYDETDLAEFLKKDPFEQKRRTQKFWTRAAVGSVIAVFIAVISPFIFDNIKQQAKDMKKDQKTASERFVAQKTEEANKKPKFSPEKKKNYLSNYTDRVLYTQGYVRKELDPSFREDWILKLNDFFVDKLGLDDNAIVPFIAQESNLIRELNLEYDKINVDYVDSGIDRMRELESVFSKDIRKIVKTKSNLKKFQNFKKNFFENYSEM